MQLKTRVWDLPTRLFHWALAACVAGLIASGYIGGAAMNWHFRLGYAVVALLLFRLIWGFVGGRWSRFSSFIYSPASLWRYLRGRGELHHAVGHSPTGALSVFGLLLILLLQVTTGMLSDDAISFTGPLAPFAPGSWVDWSSSYHKNIGQLIVIALVVLHVLAIVFYKLVKKQALTSAMVTGNKMVAEPLVPSRDDAMSRVLALVIFGICAGAVAGFLQWTGA